MASRKPLNTCRVLITPPAPGAWNMAVDEALLDSVAQRGQPVLRLYRWNEATLSLGYFQRAADAAPFAPLPLVRRPTGGGALVHHHELTYALVLPAEHALAAEPAHLYHRVHEALARALGANSALRVNECPQGDCPPTSRNAFLCFLRVGRGDLVLAGNKVAGSAQRRRRGALLQHGSLVLRRSEHAPEVTGLEELGANVGELESDPTAFADGVLAALRLEARQSQLESRELSRAKLLESKKYASSEWTRRR